MADKNVINYSTQELIQILGLDSLDAINVLSATNEYINKFKQSNPSLSSFFHRTQKRLLNECTYPLIEGMSDMKGVVNNDKSGNDDNNNDTEDDSEDYENNDFMTNSSAEMANLKENEKKVTQTNSIPIVKGILNPTLKNITQRFVNIDSQYTSSGINNSEFSIRLSERLTNVLSIRLYSYQIPYSWYLVNSAYGNNCFWIKIKDKIITITIADGSYTYSQLESQIGTSLEDADFQFANSPCTIDIKSKMMTFNLNGGIYQNETIEANDTSIVFFSPLNNEIHCKTSYMNETFGWLCGFRVMETRVSSDGNRADVMVSLNHTKYLLLVIDDYNQNHVNSSTISIAPSDNIVKPPQPSEDTPRICEQVNPVFTESELLSDGYVHSSHVKRNTYLPTEPRTLTNAQLQSLNQTEANKSQLSFLRPSPHISDVLAIIPIKVSSELGSLCVDLTGSLQESIRNYFGPVNVDKIKVRLLNDKGVPIDLNGREWSLTLIFDCLYQFSK